MKKQNEKTYSSSGENNVPKKNELQFLTHELKKVEDNIKKVTNFISSCQMNTWQRQSTNTVKAGFYFFDSNNKYELNDHADYILTLAQESRSEWISGVKEHSCAYRNESLHKLLQELRETPHLIYKMCGYTPKEMAEPLLAGEANTMLPVLAQLGKSYHNLAILNNEGRCTYDSKATLFPSDYVFGAVVTAGAFCALAYAPQEATQMVPPEVLLGLKSLFGAGSVFFAYLGIESKCYTLESDIAAGGQHKPLWKNDWDKFSDQVTHNSQKLIADLMSPSTDQFKR